MLDQEKYDKEISDYLEHIGVKGMKWGKSGGGSAKSGGGKTGGSLFNNPSVTKAVVLGSYGKKSAYTNPAALATRKKAGQLRVISAIALAGGLAASTLGRGPGTKAVGSMLQAGAGVVSLSSLMVGAKGIRQEQAARASG